MYRPIEIPEPVSGALVERAAVQVPGEGAGRFYAAQGRFHLGNTCNTWTARMLRAAGVDIDPGGVVTAGDLMGRLRR